MRRALAAEGRGIALLPSLIIADADGSLVPVLERVVGAKTLLMLVYPEREFVPPAVRAFIDEVVAWGKTALDSRLRAKGATRR